MIPTKEIAAMNFQNLTVAILLAAYYTKSLDNLYRPDQVFLLIFVGFCIGWVSTTIACYAYPPPKRWGSNQA